MSNFILGAFSFVSGTLASLLLMQTGPELTGLQALGSMGVGGIVAMVTMVWKRQDDKDRLEDNKAHKAELAAVNAQLITLATNRIDADLKIAEALNGLTTMVGKVMTLDEIKKMLEKADSDDSADPPRRRRSDTRSDR